MRNTGAAKTAILDFLDTELDSHFGRECRVAAPQPLLPRWSQRRRAAGESVSRKTRRSGRCDPNRRHTCGADRKEVRGFPGTGAGNPDGLEFPNAALPTSLPPPSRRERAADGFPFPENRATARCEPNRSHSIGSGLKEVPDSRNTFGNILACFECEAVALPPWPQQSSKNMRAASVPKTRSTHRCAPSQRDNADPETTASDVPRGTAACTPAYSESPCAVRHPWRPEGKRTPVRELSPETRFDNRFFASPQTPFRCIHERISSSLFCLDSQGTRCKKMPRHYKKFELSCQSSEKSGATLMQQGSALKKERTNCLAAAQRRNVRAPEKRRNEMVSAHVKTNTPVPVKGSRYDQSAIASTVQNAQAATHRREVIRTIPRSRHHAFATKTTAKSTMIPVRTTMLRSRKKSSERIGTTPPRKKGNEYPVKKIEKCQWRNFSC